MGTHAFGNPIPGISYCESTEPTRFPINTHMPSPLERITKPDIPMTTLSTLYCGSCGEGYVIGWFDWAVKDGKLSGGTRPIDWAMNYTICKRCKEADLDNQLFTEHDLGDLVQKWLGDFDMGLGDSTEPEFETKASFSWCEEHFRFFSLSNQKGLKPTRKMEFPEIKYFSQWFRSGNNYNCIEVNNPWIEGLPIW